MQEKKSSKEIINLINLIDNIDELQANWLLDDKRKSVQTAIERQKKKILKKAEEWQKHEQRLIIERQLYQQSSIQYIAGVDEVGRGPLAGPVVTAAVILPHDCHLLVGVNDSKSLIPRKRAEYNQLIKDVALAYSITVTDNPIIDQVNIYEATKLSMLESVNSLKIRPDYILLDAMQINTSIPQKSFIKGDQKSLSIAAASIIAKEYRDNLMKEYDQLFPEFGFGRHMGYGTREHLEALAKYGKTSIHRESFEPVHQTKLHYKQNKTIFLS